MLGVGLPELLLISIQLLIFLGVPIVLIVFAVRAFRRILIKVKDEKGEDVQRSGN